MSGLILNIIKASLHAIFLYDVRDYEAMNFKPFEAKFSVFIAIMFNLIMCHIWVIEIPEIVTKIAKYGRLKRSGQWHNPHKTTIQLESVTKIYRAGETNHSVASAIEKISSDLESVIYTDSIKKTHEVTLEETKSAFQFFADMLSRLYFLLTTILLYISFVSLVGIQIFQNQW